jgi:hypothetical protein
MTENEVVKILARYPWGSVLWVSGGSTPAKTWLTCMETGFGAASSIQVLAPDGTVSTYAPRQATTVNVGYHGNA